MLETLLLTVGAFGAALVAGATGFGFALIATALWAQLLPPHDVAVMCIVSTLSLNIAFIPAFWRDIDFKRLAPFAAGSFVGVPLGAMTLATLSIASLRFGVGLLLLGYGVHLLSRTRTPQLRLAPAAALAGDATVGLLGGFLGGLGGLSGFLPVLWCALRGWDKRANRALVQGYILLSSVLSLAWIGGIVGIDDTLRMRLLVGVPIVLLGGLLGLRLFSRFDTSTFNRVILWVLTACGAVLMIRA